ncbi:uncharacterized protein LOC129310487 [Prosopis cineraria]|uniref:uncharacterized protein LOC129310487 n=1 Tax=Prosopis cineraria TaxID=364024 RepID=UPI00240FFAD9|nr:uncharacterized protein LOC129310487 [Prosopis cineraria]
MGKEGGSWGGRSFNIKRAEAETPSGCTSSFFHFFDFHPFHLFQHQPQASNGNDDTTTIIPKGTEAPRNSLESEDGTIVAGLISKEENLKMAKNKLSFIKTTSSTGAKLGNHVNDLSPGTKTPTLVARLMGLDLLPDAQSPLASSSSPSSSSTTTTTNSSASCLSATNSRANPHLHNHHLRPRQHNTLITKARHSMDDCIAASRFLPDAPRISSARRSDVEHRLSLQINKENMGSGGEDLELLPRFSFSKLRIEEQQHSSNKSPRHYAKQIVKQMKESVMSRKVGIIEVTNTVKNREKQERGGEFVGQFRSKKSPSTTPTSSVSKEADELNSSPGKVSNNPSCSQKRLRFMDPKNKLRTTTPTRKDQITVSPQPIKFDDIQPQVSRVSSAKAKPQAKLVEQQAHQFQKQKTSVPKWKKAADEKFSPRLKKPLHTSDIIRNKQDESFVRPLLSSPNRVSDVKSTGKSKRRHSMLINLLNLNTVQNINSNALPVTKIPQKQTPVCDAREPKYCSSQLSSGSRQTYTTLTTAAAAGESNVDEDKRKTSGFMFNGPEFEYVSSILSRTGLVVKKGTTTATSVSVSLNHQWFSPTHPLDPSIFHHLEQHFQNYPTSCNIFSVLSSSQVRNLRTKYELPLGLRCNRRLLFDLVNETLLEVVGPYDEEAVWERIAGRFQSSKCEVLEDIDALIEMEDVGKTMKVKSAEAMVAEIEGNIMDTLLHETVRIATGCYCWWWYGKDHDDAV